MIFLNNFEDSDMRRGIEKLIDRNTIAYFYTYGNRLKVEILIDQSIKELVDDKDLIPLTTRRIR